MLLYNISSTFFILFGFFSFKGWFLHVQRQHYDMETKNNYFLVFCAVVAKACSFARATRSFCSCWASLSIARQRSECVIVSHPYICIYDVLFHIMLAFPIGKKSLVLVFLWGIKFIAGLIFQCYILLRPIKMTKKETKCCWKEKRF